ncbi:MAG: hypothetical protein HY273_02895 [Gammaproteobacteria bacterium]|nr:hypothetical protein [Gammaproteobacteria bacterium]
MRDTKTDATATAPKFSNVTFGQLKLRLPASMVLSTNVPSQRLKNPGLRSQSGSHPDIRVGTLDNFEDKIAQYVELGILDDSVQTFDGFFSELVNLVGTRNYPKLQKVMGINTATSAKKYPRENPSVYRFDSAKQKQVYIVFSNPKYIAEVYYLKGPMSDADIDAISAGIKN